MPLARINGRILDFVHIPKTGGTSIEAYLARKGSLALIHRRASDWSKSTPQHVHAALRDWMAPDGFVDARFAVVRDPIARLKSEYRYRIRTEPPLTPAQKAKAAVYRFRGIEAHLIGMELRPFAPRVRRLLSFEDWVRLALRRYRKNAYVMDNHIRPQAQFLDGTETVFRFEDGLEPVLRWIDAVTDTPPAGPVPHEKRSAPRDLALGVNLTDRVRAFYAEDYAMRARLFGPDKA